MAPVALIGFDGDDTLWHSERYFATIQERIRALLAPWADGATFDEALLVTERANLGRFGYGVKGFVLSTIETAIELTGGRVPAPEIGRIIEWGKELLDHPIELLADVPDVLPALAASHRLVLVTKGDLFHQETKVAGSGLGELFEAVHIVSEKTPDTYRRVLDEAGVDPASFVMVGNSLRSDVLPAVEIGARGVHVPYHITWGLEHAELPEALVDRVVHLDRLAHLPAALDRLH